MPSYAKQDKDPNDADDFTWDWSKRLTAGETISTFTATVMSGSWTAGATSIAGAKTSARMSGGVAGEECSVRGRIVTSVGRIIDWTLVVNIAEQ